MEASSEGPGIESDARDFARSAAQAERLVSIFEKRCHGFRETRDVTGSEEQSSLAMLDHFADSVDVARNDRKAGSHGLRHRGRKWILKTWLYKDIS